MQAVTAAAAWVRAQSLMALSASGRRRHWCKRSATCLMAPMLVLFEVELALP
jgi:hypothetical protein